MRTSHAIGLFIGIGTFISLVGIGCGSTKAPVVDTIEDANSTFEGGPNNLFPTGDVEVRGPCIGLECQQKTCGGGIETTLTGKVFAPDGKLALYNAIVYVPNAEVKPVTKGASCDKCGAVTGDPVVSALTDATGKFEL